MQSDSSDDSSALPGAVDGSVPAGSEIADADPTDADPTDVNAVARIRSASWGSRLGQLDQIMPVLLFLLFYKLGNTALAVAAATGWSLKAVYSRRRRGLPIGLWLPCVTVYLMLRAAVSIAVERDLVNFGVSAEAVYFGIGIATKVLLGLAAIGTILTGRSFALMAVHWVVILPEAMSTHPRFVSALRNVTWAIAFYEIGTAALDIVLYNSTSVSMFIIARPVVNFVVAFVLILGMAAYLDRALMPVPGWPGLEQLLNPPQAEADAETAASSERSDRTAMATAPQAEADAETAASGAPEQPTASGIGRSHDAGTGASASESDLPPLS